MRSTGRCVCGPNNETSLLDDFFYSFSGVLYDLKTCSLISFGFFLWSLFNGSLCLTGETLEDSGRFLFGPPKL